MGQVFLKDACENDQIGQQDVAFALMNVKQIRKAASYYTWGKNFCKCIVLTWPSLLGLLSTHPALASYQLVCAVSGQRAYQSIEHQKKKAPGAK